MWRMLPLNFAPWSWLSHMVFFVMGQKAESSLDIGGYEKIEGIKRHVVVDKNGSVWQRKW